MLPITQAMRITGRLRTCRTAFAGTLFALLVLTGCAMLPEAPPQVLQSYVLEPGGLPAPARATAGPSLFVTPVSARPPFDSTAMVYREDTYATGAFVTAEWIAPPARMIEPQVIAAAEGTGRFSAVANGAFVTGSDYRLEVELLSLQQDFTRTPSAGALSIRVQLHDLVNRRTIATVTLSAAVPAPTQDPHGGVVALNAALADVLAQLRDFLAASIP